MLRLDLLVGDYSGATAVALYAGCLLPVRRAAAGQALAVPLLLLLGYLGLAGTMGEWGYVVGRPVAAAMVAYLFAGAGSTLASWVSRLLIATLLVAAAASASLWQEPGSSLPMKSYYTAVSVMAAAIAFYYALRLVRRPGRVVSLMAGLVPYYAIGVAWALLWPALGEEAGLSRSGIVFHGLVIHLPGDALTAVVVAFFTGAKAQFGGWKSR